MQTLTGVIGSSSVYWLNEELDKGINLDWEEHVKQCPNKEHDTCFECQPSDTILIGDWKLDAQGKYMPNKRGSNHYSAIVNEFTVQVIWSKYIAKVRAYCSPCYPNQLDLESGKGTYKAYTLPNDLINEE